jgi:hypothetical protein
LVFRMRIKHEVQLRQMNRRETVLTSVALHNQRFPAAIPILSMCNSLKRDRRALPIQSHSGSSSVGVERD